MSLHPSVAAVRSGVRRVLGELDPAAPQQPTVLVACSGGADSLALLSAAVFEGHKRDVRVVGVTVDHGLQDDSAGHASRVVAQMAAMGVDETASARVTVEPGGRGTEAAAREARGEGVVHMEVGQPSAPAPRAVIAAAQAALATGALPYTQALGLPALRERIARQARAEGAEASARIRADAERDRSVLLAEARAQADRLRGEGEQQGVAQIPERQQR